MQKRRARVSSPIRLSGKSLALLELLVALAMFSLIVVAATRIASTSRRSVAREKVLTELTLAANAELARMRAAAWNDLKAGKRAMTAKEILAAGLRDDGRTTGEVEIRPVEGLALKEIVVSFERQTAMGPARASLSAWRGRRSP